VDVHQLLHRARRLQQGVAAGRHLAQARTDGDQQIRLLDALGQRRVDGNAHIAGVQRWWLSKCPETEGIAHRQLPALGKGLQVLRGQRRPARSASDHKRLFGFQ
jgi:hypothetical protein